MDNLTANKNHIPCQSWVNQNVWSTASTQGSLLNPLSSSQHLSLGLSSDQRASYDHLQESNQSCLNDLSTLSSRNSTHPSALYKASHISSNPSSTTLFANSAVPSAAHIISFAQQDPHTSSMLLNANQGKNIPPPSLSQANQAPQPCRLPLLSSNDPFKASFQPPLTSQGLSNGLQDQPISLPSCGQREQRQWMPSSQCRGAVNKSAPDKAAHPNKEPSQEGNMSSVGTGDSHRSLLLQHRAQLLKQVAELDKILESIPPCGSSAGQSQHTAVQSSSPEDDSSQHDQTQRTDAHQGQLSAQQSKSHLSSDCPSPASCDESEGCDAPDDPMSEGESAKKENGSAESEDDSDPEYLPNSDRDFSDFPSDADGGCSDESSHSRPATPKGKRSQPEKKGAELGSSSSKDKNTHSPKQIRTTKPKTKSSETVVLPTSNSKTRRVYDRRNYCLFCTKPVCKMARHLERIHSDKPEVAAAFQFPKSSRERQKIWNRLINQGNFAHNKDVMKTGKGHLVVRKRPSKTHKAQDFLHCLYCRGLFVKNALYRHMKSCPEKGQHDVELEVGRRRIASRSVLETLGDLGISEGFKSVLSQMIYNDVTEAILEDGLILQFGELLFDQHGSDPKKHEYMRQNLRQVARLVLEAQKITPMQKLEDFFLPANFPHVVSAVNVLAGYNPENKTYSIPSLAIKLGYHLQKCCSIIEGNAVKSGDESLAESARNFLTLYQDKWNKLISGGALSSLRKAKLTKDKKVPFARDVKRLHFHMENAHLLAEKNLRESPSAENYSILARVVLARTILFNRRRALEISSMKLAGFMLRKKSNVHDDMDISVSDLEKTLCEFFTRVDIRGKCGRMVPVLLKPAFVSALELLVELREKCGVPSKNPFLFARPNALSFYNGADSIQKFVKECGAKNPEMLKSTKIRKHYATMLQLMNLDENEANQILGPNNQIHSLQQDDVEMDCDEEGQQDASWDENERSGARFDLADFFQEQACGAARSSTSSRKSRKGSQNQGKHKWEEAEIQAVEKHLMPLIKAHKVPQKEDCVKCLEAESKALKNRSWKGVKDYVRNRITALKRQGKTSKAK